LVSATAVGQSYSSAAQGVVTLSATGTIAIYCTGPTGSGVQRATITAVAVGTAH